MNIEVPDDLRERLGLVLRDFGPAIRPDFREASFRRVAMEPRRVPLPSLYRFVLLETCGAVDLPRGDKTAFDVGFRYRQTLTTFALQKFGVRIYVDTAVAEDKTQAFAKELVDKLGKGVGLVEKQLLRPLADEQFDAGNVTIGNQLGFLRSTYEHFRDQARETFATKPTPPPSRTWRDKLPWRRPSPVTSLGLGEAIGGELRRRRVGAYNTLAAVNAYFSLLEHALVLVLPFVDFDPSGGRLATFIGDRWGLKLKRVFDLGNDADASRHYNLLHDIAETYRNTYSHGGFDKEGAAVWVHLPKIGALPARLSDIREAPHFEIFPVNEADLASIVAAFEGVDHWLRSAQTKYGMRWVEAGLDV
ncbi:MAG TPA: hypothetical protein VIL73_03470, partial [Gaiellaceae bacterium]